MSELIGEFRRLLEQSSGDPLQVSIELMLQQMAPSRAKQFRLCAIPHQFDPDIVRVLAPDLDAAQAEEICDEFAEFSIVMERQEGLVMHDEARRYLFSQWLRPENAAEFASASARLAEYFDQEGHKSSGEALEITQRRRMFHLLGIDQHQGFAEFERLCDETRNQFRLSEFESLIGLVHEYDKVLTRENADHLAYHEAELSIDHHQWSMAEKTLKRILDNDGLQSLLRTKVYSRLGYVYARQRNWHTAIDFYEKALRLAENTVVDHPDLVYYILHDFGTVYRDKGDLIRASELLEESIKLAEVNGDLLAIALGYNSLGTLYRRVGNFRKAISAYEKSLDSLNRLQDKFRPAQVYNNLGLTYADLSEWQKSEEFLQRSLEVKRQAGDTFGQATTLNNLARVYENLDLYQQAVETSEQAYELFKEMKSAYNMALTKCNLGKLYRRMKEPEQSKQAFTEAIELFERYEEWDRAETTRSELKISTRRRGLPWWAWVSIIIVSLLVLGVALIMVVAIIEEFA